MRTAHSKSEPKSSGSPYDGQRLRKNRMRLLTIHSSGDIIDLTTQRYRISGNVDYDAISYVWGTAPASVTAMCNNKRLLITPTVWKMLQYLHQYQAKTSTRKIWIDAICINQEDQNEKSTQIPLMGDIYSRAATVIVWMGPSTPEIEVFFAEFQDVRDKLKDWIAIYEKNPSYRNPIKEELPHNVYDFFEGLSQLLRNEWFTRLWTYQEILLPTRAALLCGEARADFDELLDFIMDGYRSTYVSAVRDVESDRNESVMVSCYAIYRYRSPTSRQERTKMIQPRDVALNLYELRDRHVKEPVDRVWAIVGLLQSELRDKVVSEVDYSKQGRVEYWKTWNIFAKALINEPGGIFLLNIPPTVQPRPSCLPSWCPNLSGSSNCRMTNNGHWNNAINERPLFIRWALSEKHSKINGMDRVKAIDNHHKWLTSTVKYDDWLRIRGFVLDTIEEVVEYEEVLDLQYGYYDSYSEEHMILYGLAVGHHMDSLDLARRVYYGKSEDVTDVPDDFVMALLMDCRVNQKARDVYCETLPKLATWYSGPGFNATREQRTCQQQWVNMRGHTFFSTKGGRIGYAHPGCKPGDQIAAFYGGEPIYILRQLTPTKDDIDSTGQASDHVQHVGVAFIPHLMEQHQRDAARMGPDTMFMIH